MSRRLFCVTLILLIAGLACSIPGTPVTPVVTSPLPEQATQFLPTIQPGSTEQVEPLPQSTNTPIPPTPQPTTIPERPVPIHEGLASLDTYRMLIYFSNNGPTALDKTELTWETRRDQQAGSQISYITNISSSKDDPEPSQSDTKIYEIGLDRCTDSDGEWELETLSPAAKEVLDVTTSMMDFSPVLGEAQFTAPEVLSGVTTNHFTFTVHGIGLQSGSEVITNQGEYWLAQDGQYLVAYRYVLEVRDSQTQEALRLEIRMDLSEINQPQLIELPAECQALKSSQP